MANEAIGGLFATVTLDISDAETKLKKLQATATSTFEAFNAKLTVTGLDKLSKSADRAAKEMEDLEEKAEDTEDAVEDEGKAARIAAGRHDQLSRSLKGVGNSLSTTLASFGAARSGNYFYALSSGVQAVTRGFGGAVQGAGAMGVAIGAVSGVVIAATAVAVSYAVALKKIADTAIESASTLERLMVSLEALLGTAQRARAEFEFLTEAAKFSPYFTDTIVSLDRMLLAQGMLNDDLRRGTMQRLIDFGSAAALTGDELNNMARALGQVYLAGRLTGEEARQLRNNALGVVAILQSTTRWAGASGEEIEKAMERGQISSRDFFEGFFVFTQQYQDAARKAQLTLQGLMDTFKDTVQLGLGQAVIEIGRFNEELSVIENLKAPIKEALAIFSQIDFEPLMASLGALFNQVLGPITMWIRSNGPAIINFFQVSLPKGILVVVNIVRALSISWVLAFKAIGLVIGAVGNLFGGLAKVMVGEGAVATSAMRGIAAAAVLMASPFVLTMAAMASAVSVVVGALKVLWAFLTGGPVAAAQAAGNAVLDFAKIWADAGAILADAAAAVNSIDPIDWEELLGLTDVSDLVNEANRLAALNPANGMQEPAFGGGSTSGGDSGSGGGGGTDAAAREIARAMNLLYDLSQRWFGLRSDLEQGLLGEEGFEATANQIAAMGQRLVEALITIGQPDAAAFVAAGTSELIKLAKKREEVAASLKEAERALADAIKDRDNFADKVRESSIKFANSFKTEEETVRSFQQFSERGFFFETESKKQKSFVDSLRERLAAMKKFLANIKKLKAAGLDEGLLEQMIAAGPEEAGEVAQALADGGQAMVDEVNTLQSSVNQVADDLAEFGAEEFYQAGVDMAQAQVDGLQGELDEITRAAESLGQAIFDTVQPWAQQMEDVGAAAGSGLGDGIEAGAVEIGGILDGINTSVGGSLADLSGMFGELPGGIAGSLLANGGAAQEAVDELFEGLRENWNSWFDEADLDFSSRGKGIVEEFVKSWLGEENWPKIKPWFDGLWTGLQGWWKWFLIPKVVGLVPLVAYAIATNWSKIKGVWQSIQDWLNAQIWEPMQKYWAELSGGEGIIGVMKRFLGVIADFFNGVSLKLNLPFSINVADWWKAIAKAINWIIDQYNKIPFLPDINHISESYRGGSFGSGGVTTVTTPGYVGGVVPAGGIRVNTRTPGAVHVYIGNQAIDEYIDAVVVDNNSTSARAVTTGTRS